MRPTGAKKTFGEYIACSTRTVHFLRILQTHHLVRHGNKEARGTWCWTCQSNHTVETGYRHRLGTPVGGSKNIENCSWSDEVHLLVRTRKRYALKGS
ncbi:hypothetical protein V6N12_028108 [Hibiscus sabdariffa]|uniref:Uncharacterized protein n=1 Tax=Hibiscus sabdariffa TaxID=183260 RepID=A0ABR2F4W5_9ROSI